MAQGQSHLPAQPSPTPGLPETPDFFQFASFSTLNTKPSRAGIGDAEMFFVNNLMPLGENNLRAIPAAGPAFYTPGQKIIHYDFFSLTGYDPSIIAFLTDGSAVQVSTLTGAQTTIAPAATFAPPAGTLPDVAQFGTNRLLIATEQATSAYWIWDGSVLYTNGGISPEIALTSSGTAYTGVPSVGVRGGSGSGASLRAIVANQAVQNVIVTNPGSGWGLNDPPNALLTFTGGGGGNSAYGHVVVNDGVITSITIVYGGSGFTSAPGIMIADATGTGARATSAISGGTIVSINVVVGGSNYTNPVVQTGGGGGSGAILTAVLNDGVISSVVMDNNGSGYTELPTVFVLSALGTGFSGTPVLSSGTITGVNISLAGVGEGYKNGDIVGFQGGGPASGTIRLMPFGVHGLSIESYQSRAWISTQGKTVTPPAPGIFFTAAASSVDFGTPDGGGFIVPTDSFLRNQWTALRQSNGFLYLVGDNSVNYVSGVQTSTQSGRTAATTTFSNLNIDPQIGSSWRDSVSVFSRTIVLANTFGIHAIYGGAVQKISTPLDGIYATGNLNNVSGNPSSAIAELYGVHVYMLLMPVVDGPASTPRNALLMWDGKRWWTADQGVTLTQIRTQEYQSLLTAWGSDGNSLYKLFANPSTATVKTVQSKLWSRPHIAMYKTAKEVYALFQSFSPAVSLTISVDTESSTTPATLGPFTAASAGINWARSRANGKGQLIGLTVSSTSADFALIELLLITQQRSLRA